MPKFQVTVIKEEWEETVLEVDAADATAAQAAAMLRVETDETIEWSWKDTASIEVIDVIKVMVDSAPTSEAAP
jgi:hypothetical protein